MKTKPIHLKVLLLTLVLLITLIIVATYTLQQWQRTRLREIVATAPNCIAPCWYGLWPGSSTKSDFWNWYNTTGNRNFIGVKETVDDNGHYISVLDSSIMGDHGATLWFEEDLIHTIDFYDNRPRIPLNVAITELGSPDAFTADWLIDMHSYVGGLVLFYEEEGVVLIMNFFDYLPTGSDPATCRIHVEPAKLRIDDIQLVAPGPSQAMLERSKGNLRFSRNAVVQAWHGFGMLTINPCAST